MQVYGAHAGLTYWLREEETDSALLEEARRIAVELKRLAPLVLRGLPLPSAEDNDISGGLRAVASGGKTKKGGAVRVQLFRLYKTTFAEVKRYFDASGYRHGG
eukprot:COSAG02_NODE_3851_length_6147_cov_3.345899_7_plen_103_part_00